MFKHDFVWALLIALSAHFIMCRSLDERLVTKNSEKYCTTQACLDYAQHVKENMDQSVNPCESFYEFNCGNFRKNQKIECDQHSINIYTELDKKLKTELNALITKPINASQDDRWTTNAKNFFASCMNLANIDANAENHVKNYIETELGGWPLLSNKSNSLNVTDILKRLFKYGHASVISISVSINAKNNSFNAIKVYETSRLPKSSFVQTKFVTLYKEYIRTVVTYLNSSAVVLDSDLDEIFNIDKSLTDIYYSKNDESMILTIDELEKEIPEFPWKELILNGIFKNQTNIKINTSTEPIHVYDVQSVRKAAKIFQTYKNSKHFVNYLICYYFFSNLNDYLPLKYLEAKQKIVKTLTGPGSIGSRESFCVSKTIGSLPHEMGKLYVSKFFKSSTKQAVTEIARTFIDQFKVNLNSIGWMDKISQQRAVEKANNIGLQMGYPDAYDDQEYIRNNLIYEMGKENFLQNRLIINDHITNHRILPRLRQKVDKNEWIMSPALLNAFYHRSNNQIYFPAAILQYPFYDPTLPRYKNYGSIGSIIGHELTHAFDSRGRFFDKNGVYDSNPETGLWTEKTVENFKNLTKCIEEQYNNYYLKEFNQTVNGTLTLSENLADIGGVKEAYRSYMRSIEKLGRELPLPGLNYTSEQMFFISLGQTWCSKLLPEMQSFLLTVDTHAPDEFRLNGVVANLDEFYQAFECKNVNSRKCPVW